MIKLHWRRWSATAIMVAAGFTGAILASAVIAENVKTPLGCGKGWSLLAIAGH